ncbi:DUF4825 domain-containing protein [Niallia sp. 01092]|uniref:DUF4825 domain-containing protein n=1 Tax=unclassified Niallia TaxID=2837522 RepID=UPI003FCF5363
MKKISILISLVILLITGCNSKTEIKSIDNVKLESLMQYKETNLGNNSAVSSIINSLPGGETYREFELEDGNSIKVIYGLKDKSSITDKDLSDYWLNDETLKKNFLYNVIAMFILIENAEEITLELDSEKYYSVTFQRDTLEKGLPGFFNKYKNDKQLWEKELIVEVVNSDKEREALYKKFPIQMNSN